MNAVVAMTYWVYVLASQRHGTLYVGVTRDLVRRLYQHKSKEIRGFTAKYGVDRLVWWRGYGDVSEAITFEKRLKRWRRDWKIRLIEAENPDWHDLFPALVTPSADSVFMGPGQPLTRLPG